MTKAVYIHIPFCQDICSYCDFCKMYYKKDWVNKYLDSLKKEINISYLKESIKTIYIGGGTPSSLDIEDLYKLFSIISIIKKDEDYEFTFECNIENITEEKIKLLYDNGVNRISYGIQSFDDKYLKLLNRHHTKADIIDVINMTKKYINNINVDLMYALPNQTLEDVENDLECFINLDIPHISTYSLIIEPHTILYNKKTNYMDEDLDYEMYQLINKKLSSHNFNHYEVSNFSIGGYESKHNLTYWDNKNYYGFGLGASGYIDNSRYENTRSFNNYVKGNYIKEHHQLTKKEIIEEEMILGLRKMEGVNREEFYRKYQNNIEEIFDIETLIEEGKLIRTDEYIYISSEYIYISNEILINFIGE